MNPFVTNTYRGPAYFIDRKSETEILHQSKFSKILGSLGASVSFDPITGNPQINFNITERSSVLKSLPQIFKLLSESRKKVIIAFDEFQEVSHYEENFAEASIRTLMQEFPEIVFLFSGSKKSMMREIFTDQMMELHEIKQDIYESEVFFILERSQKKYDPLVIRQILNDT